MTFVGLGFMAIGVTLFAFTACAAFVYWAVGSASAEGGLALMAGLGYGFQLGVLGCLIVLLSLGLAWFSQRVRTCSVRSSAQE